MAIAVALVTAPSAEAARRRPGVERSFAQTSPAKQEGTTGGQAFLKGTAKVGPKRTLHEIKAKPGQYLLMLGSLAAAGAGAEAIGVDPAPYAIGLSVFIYGWAALKSAPGIIAAKGNERLEKIGAELVWPLALVLGTTYAGKLFDHAKVDVPHPKTPADLLRAGGQTAIFTVDAPTILQTALGAHAEKKQQPEVAKQVVTKAERPITKKVFAKKSGKKRARRQAR